MKRLWFFVVLMALSSSASAGGSISFTVGGHRVHIESSRHCRSTSCASVSVSGVNERRNRSITRSRRSDAGENGATGVANRFATPAARDHAASPPLVASPPAVYTPAASTTQIVAPPPAAPAAGSSRSPFPCRHLRRHRLQNRSNPCGHRHRSSGFRMTPRKKPADSPIGDWQTEGKGTVRIAKCGNALCGYVLNASSNDKGEAILINMKPKTDRQWTGSVYSQDCGETYYGTMAIKGINTLRVEACALGRFYCSGNNWSRIAAAPTTWCPRGRRRPSRVRKLEKCSRRRPVGVTTGREGPYLDGKS